MDQKTSTTQVSNEKMSQLIVANKLSFRVPPSLSLMNSRQFIDYPAQNSNYGPGQTIIIQLSNSDIFVDGRNSYLRFKLRADSPIAQGVLSTGDYNSTAMMFSRVRYIHSSGVEITHNVNLNQYRCLDDHASESHDFWRNTAKLMGYRSLDDQQNVELPGSDEPPLSFAIPLHKIASMFNSYDDKLCPPMLLSGSRIELQLASKEEAFITTGNAALGYEVSEVICSLDSYILSDAAFSVLEQMSAKGLLEYTCEDYEVVSRTTGNDRVNIEFTKSIGRATSAIVSVRDTNVLTSYADDHGKPLPTENGVKTHQFRLNSLYLPAKEADSIQNYMNFLAYNKDAGNYTIADQEATQLVVQTLQRSEFLGPSSGLPVNSSSALRFNARFGDENVGGDRVTSLFVKHLKIIVPMLYDRVIVSV